MANSGAGAGAGADGSSSSPFSGRGRMRTMDDSSQMSLSIPHLFELYNGAEQRLIDDLYSRYEIPVSRDPSVGPSAGITGGPLIITTGTFANNITDAGDKFLIESGYNSGGGRGGGGDNSPPSSAKQLLWSAVLQSALWAVIIAWGGMYLRYRGLSASSISGVGCAAETVRFAT